MSRRELLSGSKACRYASRRAGHVVKTLAWGGGRKWGHPDTHRQHGVVKTLAALLQRDIQTAVEFVKLLQVAPAAWLSVACHQSDTHWKLPAHADTDASATGARGASVPACVQAPWTWRPAAHPAHALRLMAHSSFQAARYAGSPDCSLVTASRARVLNSSSSSNRFFDSLQSSIWFDDHYQCHAGATRVWPAVPSQQLQPRTHR